MRSAPSSTIESPVHAHAPTLGGHVVRFYEEESFLFHVVADFLAAGFEADEPAIVIATQPHLDAFSERLRAQGYDADTLRRQGLLTTFEARETLASFMVNGSPDPKLFRNNVGQAVKMILKRSGQPRLRAFGEMVDLLWKDGNEDGAMELENLWNELGRVHEFSLLCAYAMGNFYRESHGESITRICNAHSHSIPAESYATTDVSSRGKQIATLQQRAIALGFEMEQRKSLETRLAEAVFRAELCSSRLARLNRIARIAAERGTIAQVMEVAIPLLDATAGAFIAADGASTAPAEVASYVRKMLRGRRDLAPPHASVVVVPVRGAGGVLRGGLYFGHSAVGRFGTEHEDLALGVAAHLQSLL